jgi:hypothetical protein
MTATARPDAPDRGRRAAAAARAHRPAWAPRAVGLLGRLAARAGAVAGGRCGADRRRRPGTPPPSARRWCSPAPGSCTSRRRCCSLGTLVALGGRARAVVGRERPLRDPAGVGRERRRRAALLADGPRMVRRSRHHVGVGDPARLRCRGRHARVHGVAGRVGLPSQAREGARAQRVPARRPSCPSGSPSDASSTTWTPSCCAGCTTSRSSPTTVSTASTGASSSTAAPSCATSSTASPGRCRCTPRTTCPTRPAQITQALETMVRKHTDLRVWKYWHALNLVGNFDPNPDPIRRDNIMFSAFLGDVINSVESATGTDTRSTSRARSSSCGPTAAPSATTTTASPRPCSATSNAAGSGSSRASRDGRSPCAT